MPGFRTVTAAAIASFLLMGGFAEAQVAHETKISHYRIGGKTPLGLVNGMFRKGKKQGGRVLLASLATKADYSVKFPPNSCRNGKIKLNARFLMKLPVPRHKKRLSKDTAKSFNIFYSFLKKHEETHRRIMVQCLSRIQSRVNRLLSKTRSCEQLQTAKSRVDRIAAEEAKRCRGKHDALDRRDEPKINSFSLYKAAKIESKNRGKVSLPKSTLGFSFQATEINERK